MRQGVKSRRQFLKLTHAHKVHIHALPREKRCWINNPPNDIFSNKNRWPSKHRSGNTIVKTGSVRREIFDWFPLPLLNETLTGDSRAKLWEQDSPQGGRGYLANTKR